jgi:predicted ATP-grasp superfamily ATP-dependent carboligase
MELIIEGLKSYHSSKFIDDIISFNNENNEIYFINDGKTAIIKISVLLEHQFADLLSRLEFNRPQAYYYDDDDLDTYWTMTKMHATNQEVIDKLNEKISELETELLEKAKRIAELEQILLQQGEEREAVINMLREMNKLVKNN